MNPAPVYDYTTGEPLDPADHVPADMAAWIVAPLIEADGLTLVDLRTVPNDVLAALETEAGAAGDTALVNAIRQLLP